jgi:hypothetical protein
VKEQAALFGFLMGHLAVNEAVEYQMIDPFQASPRAVVLPFPLARPQMGFMLICTRESPVILLSQFVANQVFS